MIPSLLLAAPLNAVPSPRDVLQAQAAGYELVFALQGPFLLAIICSAVFLGRPGMRGVAAVYSCLSLATVSSALSVMNLLTNGSVAVHDFELALAMSSVAATWMFSRRAVRALAGEPYSTAGIVRPIVVLSALSTAVVLLCPRLPFTGAAEVLFKTAAPRPLLLLIFLACTWDAWQMSRRSAVGTRSLQLVAIAFAAMVLRQAVGITASLASFTGLVIATQTVTVIQIATNAVNGVALLAALFLEERDAVQAQAERMRAAEMRLARTQRMESLGQMAGGIAHDFANLLTAISGGVQAARVSPAKPEADEHLQWASDAVDRAAGLTKQLALFARLRPPEITVFSVGDQLRAMEPRLRRLIGPSMTLAVEVHEPRTAVRMDVSQFEQIVINLVVNARDAMQVGGRIDVSVRTIPAEAFAPAVLIDQPEQPLVGRLVALEVRDTGSGIPAGNLERIFEPYYSTKGDRGTGLGLATVKSVVRAAGGAIGVESTLHVGTSFAVVIPQV
jgi:signal transduction histidine kinase